MDDLQFGYVASVAKIEETESVAVWAAAY